VITQSKHINGINSRPSQNHSCSNTASICRLAVIVQNISQQNATVFDFRVAFATKLVEKTPLSAMTVTRGASYLSAAVSPVEIGLDPGEICTKLENGLYDAEFNGEQHIKST